MGVMGIAGVAAEAGLTAVQLHGGLDEALIERLERVLEAMTADPETDERRANALAVHIDQIKCRQKADAQHVLPRDRTDFILQCMDE